MGIGVLLAIGMIMSNLLYVSGVTIVTPIRNNPGRVRSPHANVWAGVTADTVPREDAVRHGSITLASAVLSQWIRSAIAVNYRKYDTQPRDDHR